jgi:hypothetical protein
LPLHRNKCADRCRAGWMRSFLATWSAWQRSPASGDFLRGAWVWFWRWRTFGLMPCPTLSRG